MWRLQAARTLAWALLLGGWVGLGGLSQTLAPGPFTAFALLGSWLFALGAFAALIGKVGLRPWVLRGLLVCAAALAAQALVAPTHGGGSIALLPALLAWALVVALASAAVRTCRMATRSRAGPPTAAAAAGAVLAWACVGDITELPALGPRLMAAALLAGTLLAALLPSRAVTCGACRAGLFDCSLPSWASMSWRDVKRWPVWLASLVMLPMMCSLPWMVGLCRGDGVSPQAIVAVHFAAMFAPALWVVHRPGLSAHAPVACAVLLASGALVLVAAPGSAGWWGLALAHGAAWSVAWAALLNERSVPRRVHSSPLAGAALNAVLAVALGLAVSAAGLQALAGWHIALGIVGAFAATFAAFARRPRIDVAGS